MTPACRVLGRGERDVLVLHGLGADSRQPLDLFPDALRASCRVLAPDLRGHGDTRLPAAGPDLTFEQLAADVEDLMRQHAVACATVVGVSMGAAVALELAARAVVPLRGLVLVRPAWLWSPHPANLAALPLIAELLRTRGPAAGRETFRAGPVYARIAEVSPGAARALLAQFEAPHAVARAVRLESLPAAAPHRPESIDAPVLVLASDRDPVHPLPLAEALAADLGAELVIVAPRYDEPESHVRDVHREIQRFGERT